MPIYEYHCPSCNEKTEIMQKMGEPAATACPNCGKNTLIKWVSAAGFQLKGTGWYATDFKDKKPEKKTDEQTAKPAETPAENKPATSTETKPAKSDESTS